MASEILQKIIQTYDKFVLMDKAMENLEEKYDDLSDKIGDLYERDSKIIERLAKVEGKYENIETNVLTKIENYFLKATANKRETSSLIEGEKKE